ncbi:MAG: ABC transporter permease [Candidatus Dormiibacterota bacterium]
MIRTDLRLVGSFAGYANRTFWRNPAAAFFTLFLPVFFLVLFSALFGNEPLGINGHQVSSATFTMVGIITFSVVSACYTNLAISVTTARETGFLKRVRGTPIPPWTFLSGRILQSVLVSLLLVVVCFGFGATFYHVRVPTSTLPALIIALTMGAAAFAALGLAIAALVPNSDAAPAVINFSIFPFYFVSNVFIPISSPPQWLNVLTRVFPIGPFNEAIKTAVVPPVGSTGFNGFDLMVLAIWGVGGALIAFRFFSWEPHP